MESPNQKIQYHQPWKEDQSNYRREWATRRHFWVPDMELLDREKSGIFLKTQSLFQYAHHSNHSLQPRFRDNANAHHILRQIPPNNRGMSENMFFPNFYSNLGFIQQENPYYGAASSQWITAGTELIKLTPDPISSPLLKSPWNFIQNTSFTERDPVWSAVGKGHVSCDYSPMENVRTIEQELVRPSITYTSPDSKESDLYHAMINSNVSHTLDDPEVRLPFSDCETEMNIPNNVSHPLSATIDLTDQSQEIKEDISCDTEENKFLLIDDRGIPYTVFKKDLNNSPDAVNELDEKSQISKRFHYCPVCFRTFLYLSDLERHSITHSERKPFECKVCGKSFKRSSHLQRHKHIHTGERPFQCFICHKGFRESGELQRHQRVHTGEKPYQCEICHLRFTERNTLRRHTKRKHSKEMFYQQDNGDSTDWGEALEDLPTEENLE